MSNAALNPWMLTTVGILLVGATVGDTMLVGRDSKTELPASQAAQIAETPVPTKHEMAKLQANAPQIANPRTHATP